MQIQFAAGSHAWLVFDLICKAGPKEPIQILFIVEKMPESHEAGAQRQPIRKLETILASMDHSMHKDPAKRLRRTPLISCRPHPG